MKPPFAVRSRPPPPAVALTVDLEDWHDGLLLPAQRPRVVADTEPLLACFAAAGVRATFFVLGSVARRFPELIRRVVAAGHEIGFHGAHHHFLCDVGPARFARELARERPWLQDLTGQPIHGYRAPFFSLTASTRWALPLLVEGGFRYDASIYPGFNDRYGWPGAPRRVVTTCAGRLVVFPVPLLRWPPLGYSGGAYLRILPQWLVHEAISRRLRRGDAAMIYAHPFEASRALSWEWRAKLRANITRHLFRSHFLRKLSTLLHRFSERVAPMADVISHLGALPPWPPRP